MKKQLLLLVVIMLPLVASADAVEINGIYYNLITKGNVAEVTKNPNKYTGNITIPESVKYNNIDYSVTSIGQYAFYNCYGLTSVTIPNSVTSIGQYAFYECSGLTSVTIPNSVTSIGDGAFSNCSGLTSVHISNIGTWCNISFNESSSNPLEGAHHLFLNGEEIKDLVIPSSVTSIGQYAFSGCSGLTSVNIPNSVTSIGDGAFSNCSGLTSVTIPNSVKNIGRVAFNNCYGLTSITIPNSVTSIEDFAFYLCSGLTSITIPNSVTSIGQSAFSRCSGLTSITIPNSVTSIGQSAFSRCSGLTSVTIPNSMTSIGDGAFESCSSLTSITIPNSVTSIERSAFNGCSGLTSVTIPNSVKNIGDIAFSFCSGLTSVTIPNSVTSIGDGAFSNCSGLTSVTIGNGINSIGEQAFGSCPEIKDVYCYAETLPTTKREVFKDSYIEYATLHVPASAVNAYKTADPWKNFKSIVATDGETPTTQKCEKPTISYENGQLKMSCTTEGVEYVTDITNADIKKHYDATISLTATYNISVYATKSGYENSDVVTASLCWIEQEPKTEGLDAGITQVPAKAVLIQTEAGAIRVQGADEGTAVSVYGVNGSQVGSSVCHHGSAIINTNFRNGDVVIVKVGQKSVKILMK